MSEVKTWQLRARTLRAAALLCLANLIIACLPLKLWRGRIGLYGNVSAKDLGDANREAAHIARAAWRLPFSGRCLPQAMALSWRLRRQRIAHSVIMAVRPPDLRGGEDALHAWVEVEGEIVLGELAGPWHVTARFPA